MAPTVRPPPRAQQGSAGGQRPPCPGSRSSTLGLVHFATPYILPHRTCRTSTSTPLPHAVRRLPHDRRMMLPPPLVATTVTGPVQRQNRFCASDLLARQRRTCTPHHPYPPVRDRCMVLLTLSPRAQQRRTLYTPHSPTRATGAWCSCPRASGSHPSRSQTKTPLEISHAVRLCVCGAVHRVEIPGAARRGSGG